MNCPGDGGATTLSRQELTAAPYALSAASAGGLQGRPVSTGATTGSATPRYAGYFDGDVHIEGALTVSGTKSAVVNTHQGTRALYAVGSPESWFEDFGTATLADGRVVITIDALFAETVNLHRDYHVFLTPRGDCRGLYVTALTPTHFEVRELGGGRATVEFDYRLVAKRRGEETLRLEAVHGGAR